jgi:hypothetical protein
MFNYKYDTDMTHWVYDESRNGFVVLAKEDIKAGQEVLPNRDWTRSMSTMEASLTPSS